MTDYTITTNFGAKDSLPSGNAAKVVKGSEFTTEFTNIATAVNSKADTAGDTFTGAVTINSTATITGDLTVDTDTLFVDASTNKVGIGTTSADHKLHVHGGDIMISSDTGTSTGDGKPALLFSEENPSNTDSDDAMAGIVYDGDSQSNNANYLGLGVWENDEADQDTLAEQKATTTLNITRDNKVGIGTTIPQRELEVTGTGNVYARITAPTDNDSSTLELKNTQETWQIRNTDTNDDALEFIDDTGTRLTIKKDGNVGIGTTSPAQALDVVGNINIKGTVPTLLFTDTDSNPDFNIIGGGSLSFRDETNSATRMIIDSSGNVLVGTTDGTLYNNNSSGANSNGTMITPNGEIQVARYQEAPLLLNRMGNDGNCVSIRNRGVEVGRIYTSSTATAYITSSDERLKENITDSADAGSKVDAIQIRQFDWKVDGSHQDYGVIAQELIEVVPEAVAEGDTEEDMMGVDYSKLVPLLVKEVQALRSRVAQLEESE